MPYPTNTSLICQFLGHNPETDFVVSDDAGVISFFWLAGGTAPTEQAIIDAGNDLTQVNGQTFSQWYAAHGGDATKTANQKAKDKLDIDDLLKAIVDAIVDEFNRARANFNGIKTNGTLPTIQASITNTSPITKQDVITAIKNKLPS